MYSVLLDNALIEYDSINFYVGKENGLSSKLIPPVIKNCLNLLNDSESINLVEFKSIVNFVKHLIHINNYNNLALLLDLASNKEYLDFCNLFFSPIYNKNLKPSLARGNSYISMNLLDNTIFVVKNKELFINSIKERGYNVNEGPQQ
jgi:hypothetical protein